MKDKTRKRQQRQIVDREADAYDRINAILWELRVCCGWRAASRVLLFALMRHWPKLARMVELGDVVEP
jgi:hypothetical protein